MTDLEIPSSFKGRLENFETPDWRPLEQLAADDALVLGQFMWMHAVRLEDDRLVHAYKHFETRRYLHLAEDLTAFDYGFTTELLAGFGCRIVDARERSRAEGGR